MSDRADESGSAGGAPLGGLIEEAERLGDQAPSELFAALYRELHRLARAQLRGRRDTLGATTLLHEAYLDLASREASFPDRNRFFAYAARAMRGVIIDHARARHALKRGGAIHLAGFDTGVEACPAQDLSSLSDALDALGVTDPKLAELVDLKYFCGFSFREIAEMRGISERTAQRDWKKARLFLHRSLAE
jgi:RNA polymerase sigma factor (TIGR02999 family)